MTVDVPKEKPPSRRDALKMFGALGIGAVACAATAGGAAVATGFFDKLSGVSQVDLLAADAWAFSDGVLSIELNRVPALAETASAVRVEDEALPERVLVIHAHDGDFYAYRNACSHGGRRVDLQDDGTLKCTSFGESRYEADGAVISGPAPEPLTTYPIAHEGGVVRVTIA